MLPSRSSDPEDPLTSHLLTPLKLCKAVQYPAEAGIAFCHWCRQLKKRAQPHNMDMGFIQHVVGAATSQPPASLNDVPII